MNKRVWRNLSLGLTLAGFAIACGGGGGGGGSDSSSPTTGNSSQKVSTGTFVDSSVEGITYTSGNLTGVTDAAGTFYYVPGETVTFSIGGLVLGETTGSEMVTPADLLGVDKNSQDNALVNMLRLLQTLDTDSNPDNGIKIPDDLASQLEAIDLNFDQPVDDFTYDSNLIQWLSDHAQQLVSADSALDHFYGTVEREESQGVNDHGRPWENQTPAEFIAARDTNGDSMLDFNEFKPALDEEELASITEYFTDVDVDQSGSISLDEFINDGLDGEFGDWEDHDAYEEDDDIDDFDDEDGLDDFDDEEGLDDFDDEEGLDDFDDEEGLDDLDTEEGLGDEAALEKANGVRQNTDSGIATGTFDDGAFGDYEFDEDILSDEEYTELLTEEFNKYDTNSDNTISSDEWVTYITSIIDEHAAYRFELIDIDTNGMITLEELEARPVYGDDEYDDDLFLSLDIDGSDAISLDEFLFHVDDAMAPLAEQHFKAMDENEDGVLTIDEVDVFRPRDSEEEQLEEILELDTNLDGYVDLDEYLFDVPSVHIASATEWFHLIDEDGDSLLTVDEMLGNYDDDAFEDEEDAEENEGDEEDAEENEGDEEDAEENEGDEEDAEGNEGDEEDAEGNEGDEEDAEGNEGDEEEDAGDEGDAGTDEGEDEGEVV